VTTTLAIFGAYASFNGDYAAVFPLAVKFPLIFIFLRKGVAKVALGVNAYPAYATPLSVNSICTGRFWKCYTSVRIVNPLELIYD